MIRWVSILSFFCIAMSSLWGQSGMEVSARLDTNEMRIGDKNALHIEWSGPHTLERIQIGATAWDSISGLSWLNEIPVVHEEKDKSHRYVKRLPFTVFDTLQAELPTVQLSWEEQGETQELQVHRLMLVVRPPTPSTEDWAPNEPIIREPLRWEDYRLYIFAIAFLIGLYFLYRYYKRTVVSKEERILGDPPLDPHEEAFRALRDLEDRGLLEGEQYEEFQLELSRVVRQFLSRKYEMAAMESTTREIIAQLQMTPFPREQVATVKELLSMADLVKFARAEAPGDFHRRMLSRAYRLVESTNTYRS